MVDPLWAVMLSVAAVNVVMLGLIVLFVLFTLLPFDLRLRRRREKWGDETAATPDDKRDVHYERAIAGLHGHVVEGDCQH